MVAAEQMTEAVSRQLLQMPTGWGHAAVTSAMAEAANCAVTMTAVDGPWRRWGPMIQRAESEANRASSLIETSSR
jgi:hypothetical protein